MKKILVIGLGSMGKRRVRNLLANDIQDITGVDLREDRRNESIERYGIKVAKNLEDLIADNKYDAWIISLPPEIHHIYIKKAIEQKTPCFVEASVLDTDFDNIINNSSNYKIIVAPSATLYFHPAIKLIEDIYKTNKLGKISNIIYHSGQFLPDWHTYEHVSDYYVSNPETGGGREIVPFEFTWISKIFGFPNCLAAVYKKTIDIPGANNIDDTYTILMDYPDFIINLTVDVVSRVATRRMTINGSKKQLYWNWDDSFLKIYDPENKDWEIIKYESKDAEKGYNKNISEQMYIDEIKAFLNALDNIAPFPNDLVHDRKVLNTLYNAEKSYRTKSFIN